MGLDHPPAGVRSLMQATAAIITNVRTKIIDNRLRLPLAILFGFNLPDFWPVVPVIDGGVSGLRVGLVDREKVANNSQPPK